MITHPNLIITLPTLLLPPLHIPINLAQHLHDLPAKKIFLRAQDPFFKLMFVLSLGLREREVDVVVKVSSSVACLTKGDFADDDVLLVFLVEDLADGVADGGGG